MINSNAAYLASVVALEREARPVSTGGVITFCFLTGFFFAGAFSLGAALALGAAFAFAAPLAATGAICEEKTKQPGAAQRNKGETPRKR